MKYKVGDTVRIKSFKWYKKNENKVDGHITRKNGSESFSPGMVLYCNKKAVITYVMSGGVYGINIDDEKWLWHGWMFKKKKKNKFNKLAYKIIIEDYERLLNAIPQCNLHGKCVSHAIEWIEKMKSLEKKDVCYAVINNTGGQVNSIYRNKKDAKEMINFFNKRTILGDLRIKEFTIE